MYHGSQTTGDKLRGREGKNPDRAGDSATEVRVDIDYDAPGGALGASIAKLFGEEPGQQIEQDLQRFQRVLETGDVELPYKSEGVSDVSDPAQQPVEPVNREQQDRGPGSDYPLMRWCVGTLMRCAPTPQRFNVSTLQRFNRSTPKTRGARSALWYRIRATIRVRPVFHESGSTTA